MGKVLSVIKKQREEYEERLQVLRAQFDKFDANHPHLQGSVAQQISNVCAVLEALDKIAVQLLGGDE